MTPFSDVSRVRAVAAWRDEWEDFVRSVERDQKAGELQILTLYECGRSVRDCRAAALLGGERRVYSITSAKIGSTAFSKADITKPTYFDTIGSS